MSHKDNSAAVARVPDLYGSFISNPTMAGYGNM
jgi:hypothetical protein